MKKTIKNKKNTLKPQKTMRPRSARPAAADSRTQRLLPRQTELKKRKLMVVDNEIDICNFVKSFFEMRGFKVSTALNGDDAMDQLLKEKPDIVILDIMMRTNDEGLEYLPKIKRALPGVKVLMVTGVEDPASIDTAKKLGADDYITKPLVLEYLESTVLSKIKGLTSTPA